MDIRLNWLPLDFARDRQKDAGLDMLSLYFYTDLLGGLKKILTLNLHIIVGDDAASLLANWFRAEGKIHLPKWQPEVWDHEKGINAAGFKTLNEGEQVRFDIEQGKKGPAAVNVTVV